MRVLIKEARLSGNSASVYVPKGWAEKKVLIRLLSPKEMILDVIEPHMSNIIGAYLYGSYARGEETPSSDIDALVITNHSIDLAYDKPLDMIILTPREIKTILDEDPIQLWPIIQECEPIINESYLEKLKSTEVNPRKYLPLVRETKEKLQKYKRMIERGEKVGPVIYSMMLRLRAIYLARLMMSGGRYSNDNFRRYVVSQGIEGDSYDNLSVVYHCVRDNEDAPREILTIDEILELWLLTKRENKKLEDGINAEQKKKEG